MQFHSRMEFKNLQIPNINLWYEWDEKTETSKFPPLGYEQMTNVLTFTCKIKWNHHVLTRFTFLSYCIIDILNHNSCTF